VPWVIGIAVGFVVGVGLMYGLRPRGGSASDADERLLNQFPIMAYWLDMDGTVVLCNQAAKASTGYTQEQLVGKSLAELVYAPRSKQKAVKHEAVLKATGALSVSDVEMEVLPRDGDPISVRLHETLITDGQGTAVGRLAVHYDVTRLKELDSMKTEFVSMVSHELRTPLTSIRGALGLIEGGIVGEISDKVREMIAIARSNSDRLIRIINDILDLQKLESGHLRINKQIINANDLVEAAITSVAEIANQSDIRLQPKIDADITVRGDEGRLVQVLVNLLGNAIKFSPAESSVVISAVLTDSGARFGVRDNGPGIADEHRDHVFERFNQADASDTRARGGTGLGLTIAKTLVELHDGEIGLDSELGKGSEFYFVLPVARA